VIHNYCSGLLAQLAQRLVLSIFSSRVAAGATTVFASAKR
jgi:hypothetical protein